MYLWEKNSMFLKLILRNEKFNIVDFKRGFNVSKNWRQNDVIAKPSIRGNIADLPQQNAWKRSDHLETMLTIAV